MDLSTIKNTGNWGSSASRLNENFSKVGTEVDKLKYAAYNSKLYASEALLKQAIPSPSVGDWAIVGNAIPGEIYRCDTDGEWTATGQTGGGYGMEVTEKHVTEQYVTEVHNEYTGDIVNNPDDEDLISEEKPEGSKVLKLADKMYNAATFSGMGRVYLRKNISGSKNLLTQAMVAGMANTRFIVQYDYDLNGGTLEIPEGCTLDFQGGILKNGTISFPKGCRITAGHRIFQNVLLEEGSLFSDTDIDPVWFGVVGDGVTDDTASIKYMLSFCKNIYNNVREVRNSADRSPRIVFKKLAYYKITSPICIDFKCHVVGGPVFLYTGEEIADDNANFSTTGAAVIITNQYNTSFDFSVVRLAEQYVDADNVIVDLSSGILFAGIKTGKCVWCKFNIHQIFGFSTGMYLACKGDRSTWQNLIELHYVTFTLNAVLVDTIEKGFSNGNRLSNMIFLGPTGNAGGLVVPSGFNHGCCLKFTGDGSYGANSWLIDNIQVEGKILATYPIYFMEIQMDSIQSGFLFRDFSIKNLRLEGIGKTASEGVFMKSNAPHQNIRIETNLYNSVQTMEMDYYGMVTSIGNPVVKASGIIYSDVMVYGIDFKYKAMASMLSYCGRFYNLDDRICLVGRKSDVTNTDEISLFATPSYIIDIAPGQTFTFTKQQTQRAYFLFYDSDGNRIDLPDSIRYDMGLYKVVLSGYKDHLSTSSDSIGGVRISNVSNSTTYRFSIAYLDDYRLDSNRPVVTNSIVRIRTRGTTGERPSLSSQSDGFRFYNTTTSQEEILSKGKWISVSDGGKSTGYLFDFSYAKRCLQYLNMYYAIDDTYRLVGISTYIPQWTPSLTIYCTVGEYIKLLPGQKISFSNKAGQRMYIVFYDSNMNKIDYPSDVSYDTAALYEASIEGYKTHLKTANDSVTSGYIQNVSQTEYYVSFVFTGDYTLTSNMDIVRAANTGKLKFHGKTSERPVLGIDNKGYQYYDIDLSRPVWWTGTGWINGEGTAS